MKTIYAPLQPQWHHGLRSSSSCAGPLQSELGSRSDYGVQPASVWSSREPPGHHRRLRQGVLRLSISGWNICSEWQQKPLVGGRVPILQYSGKWHPEARSTWQRLSLRWPAWSLSEAGQEGNPWPQLLPGKRRHPPLFLHTQLSLPSIFTPFHIALTGTDSLQHSHPGCTNKSTYPLICSGSPTLLVNISKYARHWSHPYRLWPHVCSHKRQVHSINLMSI